MNLLLLLLLGCDPTADGAAGGGRPDPLVETSPVRDGTLSDRWSLLGDVRALDRAELAAAADGPLKRVNVREGQSVTRGTLLAEVDTSVAAAELAAARAEVQRARAALQRDAARLERMRAVGAEVLADQTLDDAQADAASREAELAAAEAREKLAAARLERHRIRAPFDGQVARRLSDPGDWVGPGTPVLDIVSVGSLEVRVEAPLELTRLIHEGLTAQLGSDGQEISATVQGVVPALDPVSRTSVVRLVPDVETEWLAPGLAVNVTFPVTRSGGVVIPRDALVTGPVDEKVFKLVEGAAQPVVVTRIASSSDEVLVSGALAAGDIVVTRGNERLRPGQTVRTGE